MFSMFDLSSLRTGIMAGSPCPIEIMKKVINDMIIRGGGNKYPREIEEFLHNMKEIRDVQVVGVKSTKYGEEVGAFIICKENTDLAEVK